MAGLILRFAALGLCRFAGAPEAAGGAPAGQDPRREPDGETRWAFGPPAFDTGLYCCLVCKLLPVLVESSISITTITLR